MHLTRAVLARLYCASHPGMSPGKITRTGFYAIVGIQSHLVRWGEVLEALEQQQLTFEEG
ncbi:MAG: hypothetical protein KGL39_20835 [Patescibacteria group bacterium]|nr:hypothetical protein [Patescibacteria group bacterium]